MLNSLVIRIYEIGGHMFLMRISKSKTCEIDSISVSARAETVHQVRVGTFTNNFAMI